MILLCGIPSEAPLAMVHQAARALNLPTILFNQRRFADTALWFEDARGQVTGWLEIAASGYRLEDVRGVYLRLMDDRFLPELKDEPTDSLVRSYCRSLHDTLLDWAEITPARVLNRMSAMSSNNSKPFQLQLIRQAGFEVPETLITNDPELVREFHQRHPRLIYKSTSGVRSMVQTFQPTDLDRLNLLCWCPVQFQEFIAGDNIRVHVVGSRVYATRAISEATDYRYAQEQVGQPAELQAMELPDELAQKCVQLASMLGLPFAGIDLKLTPDQQVFCFEVNPSPGFSYYEANTGQPIAEAVARYLGGQL